MKTVRQPDGAHSRPAQSFWFRGLLHALLACVALPSVAAESDAQLSKSYVTQIHPLLVKTCGKCHGETPKDNDLDLAGLTTAESLFAKPAVLADVAGRLLDGDMPPRKATQPTQAEREQLLNWRQAPSARFCHPSEERLLPLHVCYGAAQTACAQLYEVVIMSKKSSMYLW